MHNENIKPITLEYSIADHWLPAIFNDDLTGLSDTDCQQFIHFMENELDESGGYFVAPESQEYDNFQTDEISGLMANCYNLKFNC